MSSVRGEKEIIKVNKYHNKFNAYLSPQIGLKKTPKQKKSLVKMLPSIQKMPVNQLVYNVQKPATSVSLSYNDSTLSPKKMNSEQ